MVFRPHWQDPVPLFTYRPWGTKGDGLGDDPRYFDAKKRRDPNAAYGLCQDLCLDHPALDALADHCLSPEGPPIIVAPRGSIHESKNALALGYALWLADDLGWPASIEIGQTVSVNRDFVTDNWFRLVHQPEFYGNVSEGRTYVLADDVLHMGGTLASLRGFILSKGGRVICATALAHGSYGQQFALAEATRVRVESALGGDLAAIIREELGYEVAGLSEPEAQFLLTCPSADSIRNGISGAR